MKESEELKKWSDIPCSWKGRVKNSLRIGGMVVQACNPTPHG
jgi:hypothetical protein